MHHHARAALYSNMCEKYYYVVDNEGTSYEVTSVGPKRKMKLAELPMATLVKSSDDDNDSEIPKVKEEDD